MGPGKKFISKSNSPSLRNLLRPMMQLEHHQPAGLQYMVVEPQQDGNQDRHYICAFMAQDVNGGSEYHPTQASK